jgi:hypothetical protein
MQVIAVLVKKTTRVFNRAILVVVMAMVKIHLLTKAVGISLLKIEMNKDRKNERMKWMRL